MSQYVLSYILPYISSSESISFLLKSIIASQLRHFPESSAESHIIAGMSYSAAAATNFNYESFDHNIEIYYVSHQSVL